MRFADLSVHLFALDCSDARNLVSSAQAKMHSRVGEGRPAVFQMCTTGTGFCGIFSSNIRAGVCGSVWEMVSF